MTPLAAPPSALAPRHVTPASSPSDPFTSSATDPQDVFSRFDVGDVDPLTVDVGAVDVGTPGPDALRKPLPAVPHLTLVPLRDACRYREYGSVNVIYEYLITYLSSVIPITSYTF